MRQQEALVAEGVEVTTGRTGDLRVDCKIYGWFPSRDEIETDGLIDENHELREDDQNEE